MEQEHGKSAVLDNVAEQNSGQDKPYSLDDARESAISKEMIKAKALLFVNKEGSLIVPAIRLLASISISGKIYKGIVSTDNDLVAALTEKAERLGLITKGYASQETKDALKDLLLSGTEFKGSYNDNSMFMIKDREDNIGTRLYEEVKDRIERSRQR
ncbi:MAG: hypothetical protein AABY33_08210 [Pseudomonadota bacterium]